MLNYPALALKNVSRQKKRSFTLGVNYAIVAFLLCLLFSFSRGAAENVTSSLARSSAGHITVSGQFARDGRIFNGIERASDVAAIAKARFGSGSTVIARYLVQSALYYKGLSKRLGFTGIDMAADSGFAEQMTFVSGSWADVAADQNGVAVPKDVADYFGLAQGEEIVLSARTRFGAFNTGLLKVRAVYTTDNYFMRGFVLTHFDFLRSLDLGADDTATTMYVYLPKAEGLGPLRDAFAADLRKAGFEATKPQTDAEAISAISAASVKYEVDKEGRDRVMLKLSTLDEVLGLVRTIIAAVNGIGAFVAAILLAVIVASIFINLRMTINERLREIGTMRAIGLDRSDVTALFVTEGAILAFVFSAAGAILAALVAAIFRLFVSLPPGGELGIFLRSGRLALAISPIDLSLVVATITCFAAFFSFFPARKGGSVSPVRALASNF